MGAWEVGKQALGRKDYDPSRWKRWDKDPRLERTDLYKRCMPYLLIMVIFIYNLHRMR